MRYGSEFPRQLHRLSVRMIHVMATAQLDLVSIIVSLFKEFKYKILYAFNESYVLILVEKIYLFLTLSCSTSIDQMSKS